MAKADIGETHQLKEKRVEILSKIESFKADTLDYSSKIDSLEQLVLGIDKQIMVSYDETIARLSSNARQQNTNARSALILGLVFAVLALIFLVLIVFTRKRLEATGETDLTTIFKSIVSDFVQTNSAEKSENSKSIRVNAVVVIGLLFMSLSVLAFLVRNL